MCFFLKTLYRNYTANWLAKNLTPEQILFNTQSFCKAHHSLLVPGTLDSISLQLSGHETTKSPTKSIKTGANNYTIRHKKVESCLVWLPRCVTWLFCYFAHVHEDGKSRVSNDLKVNKYILASRHINKYRICK